MDPTGSADHDELDRALSVLGLEGRPAWDDIRGAYRSLVRESHPDVANAETATVETATINAAFAKLRAATDDGRRALPARPAAAPATRTTAPVVLRSRPGDIYVNLLEAAYEVGDVCYLDPEAGLIQVLLTEQGAAGAHLLIDIDQHEEPPRVAFTLESADSDVAPIGDVVARLAGHLRTTTDIDLG